ncbi:MAG TPA: ATP-binding protein [Burkholderiaceae bacterium]
MSETPPTSPPAPPRDAAADIAQFHEAAGQRRAELQRLQQEVVLAQMRLGVGQSDQLEAAGRQLVASLLQLRDEAARAANAEASAATSRRQLADLYDLSHDALVKIDDDGAVIEFNPQAERTFGWSRAEALRLHVSDLLPGDDLLVFQHMVSKLESATLGDAVPRAWPSLHARRKGGEVFPVLVGLGLGKNEKPFVLVAFDDTSQRDEMTQALRDTAQTHLLTLDHLLEGCQIFDAGGRCRYANPEAARQAGRPIAALVGRIVTQAPAGTESPDLVALVQRCMDDRVPLRKEVDAVSPGGLHGRFLVGVVPTSDGVTVLSVDISEQARAKEEVRVANEALEQRVIERTLELHLARQAADAANRAKSAFLAAMSHEIRTPMNGVLGMIEVLSHTELSPELRDTIRTIRTSAFALLGVVDDILDFSKIEAGKIELEREPVVLHELVESVCDTLVPVAQQRNVKLRVFVDPRLPLRILADPTRLRQILMNLLNNAVKFSGGRPGKDGSVSVRAEAGDSPTPTVVLRVQDNGIGMSAEAQATLFAPFTQAESSTTRRFGGSGLGLAISKRLVDLMRGQIEVSSEVGVGSTFVATLPIEPADASPPSAASDLSGVACILVGSHEGDADLRSYLEHAGALVTLAPDTRSAIAAAAGVSTPVFIHQASIEREAVSSHCAEFASVQGARHLVLDPERRAAVCKLDRGIVAAGGLLLRRSELLAAVAIAADRIVVEDGQQGRPRDEQEPGMQAIPAEQADARGRLVLVAEDDEVNQIVIRRELEMLGYRVEIAGDGQAALDMWARGSYALLLTDLHMPVLDGYALAEAIRRAEATRPSGTQRPIPIIALTADALRGDAAKAGRRHERLPDQAASIAPVEGLAREMAAGSGRGVIRAPSASAPMNPGRRATPCHEIRSPLRRGDARRPRHAARWRPARPSATSRPSPPPRTAGWRRGSRPTRSRRSWRRRGRRRWLAT